MSVEDLMKSRYKLMVDYPGNDYEIGFVFDNEDAVRMQENIFKKYPHVFRKLEWWEERDEEDMPEYVKTFYDYGDKIPYQYFKIERWDMGNVRGIINKINRKVITLNGLVKPCSEQEYLNYINKTNENK